MTFPLPFTEGNCAGIGRDDLRVVGDPDATEPVWAEADGGGRLSIQWPRGSVAVFAPELTVVAPDGTTLARQGDRIGDSGLNGREVCVEPNNVRVWDRPAPSYDDSVAEPVTPPATPMLPPVEEFAFHVREMADGRDLERALEVANADSRSLDDVHFAMEELSSLLQQEHRWYVASTASPCFRDVHERYGDTLQTLGAARALVEAWIESTLNPGGPDQLDPQAGWVEGGGSDTDRQLGFSRIRAVAPQFQPLAAEAEDAVRRCR